MPISLVIGASRGLGLALTRSLLAKGHTVYATVRTSPPAGTFDSSSNLHIIEGVDLMLESAGEVVVSKLQGQKIDLVVVNAGVFKSDSLDNPGFSNQIEMYTIVAVAPVVLAHSLRKAKAFALSAKFILITTEGGSISLRTKEEGGGNYGHHGSKAAANMAGKLLSNDFYEEGITVAMIHPGFMKTDMTKGVGFDKFYESGGAVEPSIAAESTLEFIEKLTHEQTGTFWAPRGPRDIGEAERVLGKNLSTPLALPW